MRVINENCETGFDRYDSFVKAMSGIAVLGIPHSYPEDPPEETGAYLIWFMDGDHRHWAVHWYLKDDYAFGVLDKMISYWLPLPDAPEAQNQTLDARSAEDRKPEMKQIAFYPSDWHTIERYAEKFKYPLAMALSAIIQQWQQQIEGPAPECQSITLDLDSLKTLIRETVKEMGPEARLQKLRELGTW